MSGRHPALGITLILTMAACFATLDTSVKYLGAALPVLVILWSRYLFQAVVMLVWQGRRGWAGFRAARPGFQLLRGTLLLSTSCLSFFGLQYLPVAEFTAIAMLTPVMVTLLAATVLHEKVSRLRWVLVGTALAGALMVVRPGSGLFGWAAAFPLGLTVAYAAFQVLTSRFASVEDPYTTHFYTGLVGAVAASAALWVSPLDGWGTLLHARAPDLGLLLLVGAMGTLGHLCLILALGMAPASTLMPFSYSALVFATLGGALVFRHVPDGWAMAGMAVIGASGAASVWLNMREHLQHRPVSPVAADTVGD
ncbi:DMT family transporter [Schlegelella sp. S2-27]|uniref:DMT family transporter n=1 Tax=Caldimonas mangrovi TaxID=2944811 RepID=A0ABT0YGV1_9BURK|nr:DMT family transporter [Caldimonas mangrovi]